MWLRPLLADVIARRSIGETDAYSCILDSALAVLQRTLGWKVTVTGTLVHDVTPPIHQITVPDQIVNTETIKAKSIRVLGLEVQKDGLWYRLRPELNTQETPLVENHGYPMLFADNFGSFTLDRVPAVDYPYRASVAIAPSSEYFENIDLPDESKEAILTGAMYRAFEIGTPDMKMAEAWNFRHLNALGNLSGLLMASSGQLAIRPSSFVRK